jgi:hypothetical protein
MKYDLTPFCHKIRQSFVTLALHDTDDIHTTVTNTQLRQVQPRILVGFVLLDL